jgi:hypothetical protein
MSIFGVKFDPLLSFLRINRGRAFLVGITLILALSLSSAIDAIAES